MGIQSGDQFVKFGMSEMTGAARTAYLGLVLVFGMSGAALSDGKPRQFHEMPAAASKILAHPKASARGVVPIFIENGQVIINVMINGQGPFPMMFDTGGVEVVTSETATALGLEVKGAGTVRGSGEGAVPMAFTHIKGMHLGDVELSDLDMPVLALPRFFTDRGTRPPLAGLLGYNLLARFAVRLDYESRMLTLTPSRDFHYRGAGAHMPLFTDNTIPVIPAAADGIAGRFEIDTGSSDAIVLQRRFVEQYGFEVRHPGGPHMKVAGADGIFESIAARLSRFTIANAEIERPVVELPSGGRSGLPRPDVDGSIGYQILRQFVITFDYSHRNIWLERSAAFGMKTVQWKTGFQAVKADDPGFRVITVLPNTPAAAAGINVDDVITEVDGRAAASVGQAEFSGLMRGPDGTVIRLGIVRDGIPYVVTLTLKELLP
jgi:Aspartyl protease/PDZ domain